MSASVELTTLIRSALIAIPGMRVGQLIDSALTTGDRTFHDLFNIPDQDLANCIRNYVSRHLNKRISLGGTISE